MKQIAKVLTWSDRIGALGDVIPSAGLIRGTLDEDFTLDISARTTRVLCILFHEING